MKRSDFLKTCAAGGCGCGVLGFLAPLSSRAENVGHYGLAKVKTAWLEKAEYDEKTGILGVVGKPNPCACPLVKIGRTPADICNCTLGWQQEAFSTITGKPFTAEIEEPVLRGGKRCSFRITVKA